MMTHSSSQIAITSNIFKITIREYFDNSTAIFRTFVKDYNTNKDIDMIILPIGICIVLAIAVPCIPITILELANSLI
jgi:hypothetical protein